MIRILLAAVLATLTVVAIPSVATSVARAQAVGAAPTFTPAELTTIRKWIKRQQPAAVRDLSVGATLPMDVESYPVPKDWGRSVARYRYVHSGKHVYFVEPYTGKVVFRVD
jgi:hypothetical protein